MGGSRASAAASSRNAKRHRSASPAAARVSDRASSSGRGRASSRSSGSSSAGGATAAVTLMRTRARTRPRTSGRAHSVPPPHKYDSPRSAAEMLKRAQEAKRNAQQTKIKAKRARSAKSRGRQGAATTKKAAAGTTAARSSSNKGKQAGSASRHGGSRSASSSKARGKGKGKRSSSSSSSSDESSDVDGEVATVARPAAAPRMTPLERDRQALIKGLSVEGLEERIRANVAHWSAVNAAPLDSELVEAAKAARAKQKGAEEEEEEEEQNEDDEEDDDEEEQQTAAASVPAPTSAPADVPVLVTARGRISKKPEPAGKPLGALGVVRSPVKKKAVLRWKSEEYRKANREKYQSNPTTEAQRAEAAASASATALAAASAAAAAVSAAAAAATAAAAAHTSSQLDPLEPDRSSGEVFQIPAAWRLQWTDPSFRLMSKLAHLPTSEFDRHQSFELPFDQFGEMMVKFQKKDQPPRFTLVTQNRLRVTREFFNTAMGVVPRRATRADRDDEESDAVCTCRYRDPASAPRKGSKEALAENAAGRSFNCGDDCINRLLKIECTDANCGLVASGRTDACGNRLFQRASYFPGVEPFKTEFKGWGLRCATSSVPAGSFILEYVGEIISNAMCQERMAAENERCRRDNEQHMKRREEIRKREQKQRHAVEEALRHESERVSRSNPNGFYPRVSPRDQTGARRSKGAGAAAAAAGAAKGSSSRDRGGKKKRSRIAYDTSALSDSSGDEAEYMEGLGPQSSNFYFLTIGDDVIIDAGVRGGNARFTNHSCAPNCHIEKWTVDGQVRIGIFANQAIPAGKELTIDYKYDRVGNVHRQACFCGEPNCAKFIGGRKKEVESEEEKKKVRSKKAKEPTKLNLDLADQVCAMCGDGGDMIACDGPRVCGQFCTRCYHLECVGLTEETAPARWVCPYHSCDGCDSMRTRYYCKTCSESACDKCWNASRLGPLDTEEVTLHLTRVRRDLSNYARHVWTMCHTCQQDAMCLREEERAAAYDSCAALMREAIRARRADPDQAGFGADLDPQTLVEQMDAQTFSPRFLLSYWHITQQKRGTWDDGYVEPSLRDLVEPEEESDQAFLARQYAEANPSEGEEEEEEEDGHSPNEECKRQEEQGAAPPSDASTPAAAATAAAAAAAAGPSSPPDAPVPMEVDDSEDEAEVEPVPPVATRNRKGAKGKRPQGAAAAAAAAPAVAAAATAVPAVPAAAPAAGPAVSSRKRGLAAAAASPANGAPAAAPTAASAAAVAASSARKPSSGRRAAPLPPSSPVTPRTRAPSAIAVAAAATAPSSHGKSRARPIPNGALVSALVVAAAATVAGAGAGAGGNRRSAKRKHASEQTETESSQSSDSEVDTRQAIAAKRAKRVSTSSKLLETLSEEVLLRLTTELSAHASRVLRGSPAEKSLLAAQAKACGNKASSQQIRAVWESVMHTNGKPIEASPQRNRKKTSK